LDLRDLKYYRDVRPKTSSDRHRLPWLQGRQRPGPSGKDRVDHAPGLMTTAQTR
jgi:hypothetical protein